MLYGADSKSQKSEGSVEGRETIMCKYADAARGKQAAHLMESYASESNIFLEMQDSAP